MLKQVQHDNADGMTINYLKSPINDSVNCKLLIMIAFQSLGPPEVLFTGSSIKP